MAFSFKKGGSAPSVLQNFSQNRDSERTHKFFKRFSSIKVNYEKDNRRTVQSYMSHKDSGNAIFLRPKVEISKLLWQTLQEDDLEDAYVELLSLLFPPSGNNTQGLNLNSNSLMEYLQKIFRIDNNTHNRLLQDIRLQQSRERVLHLEVLEARNLTAKDLNGLSDPFCTLYVTTKDNSKRTKVVQETLNPVWNESFKFIINDTKMDYFKIEVWDHDPEERMRDKLSRIGQVKSPGAVTNFIREMVHGRKSAQEKIGSFSIPIKEISSETTEKWCPLGDRDSNGEIYLRMCLGVKKGRQDAVNDYRILLQLSLIHELTDKNDVMVAFHWEHGFGPWTEYILRQLRTGWGLGHHDVLLAKWIAYIRNHSVFPVSGRIFPPLVHEIFEAAGQSEYNSSEVEQIIRSTNELIAFSVGFVEQLHEFFPCIVTTSQLYYVLKTLEILCKSIDKVRVSCSTMTHDRTKLSSTTIRSTVHAAIRKSAKISLWRILESCKDFFKQEEEDKLTKEEKESTHENDIKETEQRNENSSPETPFELEAKKVLRVGQLLNDDLLKGLSVVDKDFKMILGLDYHHGTYQIYDFEFEKMVRPLIQEFCNILKKYCSLSSNRKSPTDTLALLGQNESAQSVAATNFLNLYLCLKKFAELGPALDPKSQPWRIANGLYDWFQPGISHLLDLFGQVWMSWMTKAVTTDYERKEYDPESVISFPGHVFATITSSAVDSVQIFIQIQTFWTALDWPNPEESTKFAAKLLQELCGYSISYANLVTENLHRVEQQDLATQPDYYISERLCRSINNIEYVGIFTEEIAVQLNLGQILTEIKNNASEMSFMDRQIDIQKSGLQSVLQRIFTPLTYNLQPKILTLLRSIAEAGDEAENGIKNTDDNSLLAEEEKRLNQLFLYMSSNIITCEKHLLPSYFMRIIHVFWSALLNSLEALIQESIKQDQKWPRYKSMKRTFLILRGYLEAVLLQSRGSDNDDYDLKKHLKFNEILQSLETHATSSVQVKMEYYAKRFQHQQQMSSSSTSSSSSSKNSDRGFISVRTFYQIKSESLFVEILNSRNLLPFDSNGSCDPYAQLTIVPIEAYPEVGTFSTKVQRQTLYPLFEETFIFNIPEDLRKSEGYLLISLWDHDYIKRDRFLGDALLKLNKIPLVSSSFDSSKPAKDSPQQQLLTLTLPTEESINFLKNFLSYRPRDKDLSRFTAKELEKSLTL